MKLSVHRSSAADSFSWRWFSRWRFSALPPPGFAVALHRMAAAASLAQNELRITRILDSALDETLSLPVLEEGETNTTLDETGHRTRYHHRIAR